jgi:HSP20 family protein
MRRLYPVLAPSEVADFADEVRVLFQELALAFGTESLTGECSPTLDVVETEKTLAIAVDLPGVDPGAVSVMIKGDTVLIVGQKSPRRGGAESTFHLVERGFGRFARTVRLDRAVDAANAEATLRDGELRVTVPKISDRRGRSIRVPIQSTTTGPA